MEITMASIYCLFTCQHQCQVLLLYKGDCNEVSALKEFGIEQGSFQSTEYTYSLPITSAGISDYRASCLLEAALSGQPLGMAVDSY